MSSSTVVRVTILSTKYVEGSKLCVLVFSARQHFCCKIIVVCNNMGFKCPPRTQLYLLVLFFFICSD
jgi:hypothetical protein